MGKPNIDVFVGGPVNSTPDRVYATKYLKPNIPFGGQVTEENTKYVVKHNFDLKGASVTIPQGCILSFDGGIIDNGTLVGQDTVIDANPVKVFGSKLGIVGGHRDGNNKWINEWNTDKAYAEWFGVDKTDCHDAVQKTIDVFNQWDLLLDNTYNIGDTIVIRENYTNIKGGFNSKIIYTKDSGALFYYDSESKIETWSNRVRDFSVRNIIIQCSSDALNNNASCFMSEQGIVKSQFLDLNIAYFHTVFNFIGNVRPSYDDAVWDCFFRNVKLSFYKYGLYAPRTEGNRVSGLLLNTFENVYFNCPIDGGVSVHISQNSGDLLFNNCNFGGSQDTSVRTVHVNLENNVRGVRFVGCNFEDGYVPTSDKDNERTMLRFNYRSAAVMENCTFRFVLSINRKYEKQPDGTFITRPEYSEEPEGSLIYVATNTALDLRHCDIVLKRTSDNLIKDYGVNALSIDEYTKRTCSATIVYSGSESVPTYFGNTIRQDTMVANWRANYARMEAYGVSHDAIPHDFLFYNTDNYTLRRFVWDLNQETVDYDKDGEIVQVTTQGGFDPIIRTISFYNLRNTTGNYAGEMVYVTGLRNLQTIAFWQPDLTAFDGTAYRTIPARWVREDGLPVWRTAGSTSSMDTEEMKVYKFTPFDYGYSYYNYSLGKLLVLKSCDATTPGDWTTIQPVWKDVNGFTPAKSRGTENERPTNLTAADVGFEYYDTTLHKAIYLKYEGGIPSWVDALGNSLNTVYDVIAGSNVAPNVDQEPSDEPPVGE